MDLDLRLLERSWRATGLPEDLRKLNLARKRHGLIPISGSNISDPRYWGGYITHHLTQEGRLIVMVRTDQADIDEELGRFALVCDEHGGLFQRDSVSELSPELEFSEDWCHRCRNEKDHSFMAFNEKDRVQNIVSGQLGRITWAGSIDFVTVMWDDGVEQHMVPINILANRSKDLLS